MRTSTAVLLTLLVGCSSPSVGQDAESAEIVEPTSVVVEVSPSSSTTPSVVRSGTSTPASRGPAAITDLELPWCSDNVAPVLCSAEGWLERLDSTIATVIELAAGDTLNLREGPGAEYAIVGEALPKARLGAFPNYAPASDGGQWKLVSTSESWGWVNASFLEEQSAEDRLIRDFLAFVRSPTQESLDALPLDEQISLGLGPNLLTQARPSDLLDPDVWMLNMEAGFRAYVGPFSIFQQDLDIPYKVSIGAHPHCINPPTPAPEGFAGHQRISVQPSPILLGSCLDWFTIDLFLTPDGAIQAITLDLYEP